MYFALLLCQSNVNLCAVSIQELDARRVIIHLTTIMQCVIFSCKVLYCGTFFIDKYFIKSSTLKDDYHKLV